VNPDKGSSSALGIAAYQQAWVQGVCQVLEDIGAGHFTADTLAPGECELQIQKLSDQDLWLQFVVVVPFTGEQAVAVNEADGVRLTQMLLGEPQDESTVMSSQHRDAAAELLRQIAGGAAMALGARLKKEVEIKFVGAGRPSSTPAVTYGFRFTDQQGHAFCLYGQLSRELTAALELGPHSAEATEPPRGEPSLGAAVKEPAHDANIDLLMDVELEVTLRFGQRQLLLRDILELTPGTVVELDQQITEPVELLVGRKVVARGEVVVVEGSYGIRVTEIASRQERLESLRS
jgi:flagellar motor switch protein FliN/FliY